MFGHPSLAMQLTLSMHVPGLRQADKVWQFTTGMNTRPSAIMDKTSSEALRPNVPSAV